MSSVHRIIVAALVVTTTGCGSIGNILNPFYESPSPVAYFGNKNDSALNEGSGGKAGRAREALEGMANYQRALAPQPNNPVMQPAVVRLMWIPDHLNSHGDLVPAHYYYLKVKSDQWAVTDAFELEHQLGTSTGNASAVGFVNPEDIR